MTAPGPRAAGAALPPPPYPQSAGKPRDLRAAILLFSLALLAGLAPGEAQAQASITWTGSFTESAAGDGSVTGTVTGTLTGDTFTDEVTALLATSLANRPAGLSLGLIFESNTRFIVTMTGNADDHADADDVSNLTISFGNGAFTGGNAANVANSTKSDIAIDFHDPSITWGGPGFTESPDNDGTVTGYGLPAFDGRLTATPHAGFTLGESAREFTLGWRLAPATRTGLDFDLGLEATRREAANDDDEAEHGIGLKLNARF